MKLREYLKVSSVLDVFLDTHTQKKYILYRESSNSSNLALICKSKTSYDRIMWIRHLNQTEEVMIAAERAKDLRVHGVIVPANHSSTFYNGTDFIFHISPVKFSYSGTYRCLVNDKTYSSLTLHTLRGNPSMNPFFSSSITQNTVRIMF